MSIEENKKILQRYFDELMNNGDYSKVNEIIHKDFSGSGGGGIKGIEAQKRQRDYMYSSAPDAHIEILEMIAEGDKVAVFQEVKGTLTGEYQGIKGKGQPIDRVWACIYEFKDGKVFRGLTRIVIDQLSFFQQVGALPPTEEIVKAYNESQQ
ncbi:MAG: ester cyclase [Dehalococcoidales bacterium]|nr:MAG: ester cyclase [Dehalococcoidales bacterium]